MIVGIDPGIKTGYAVIDLDGRLVASGCEKEANEERIINKVIGHGIPVLLASDTSPAPSFAKKMAARLNIKLFSPRKSLTKMEKRMIGKEIGDPHIRDSYAAAVKAYRRYSNRLRQIDSMEISGKEELKKMVITGTRIGAYLNAMGY